MDDKRVEQHLTRGGYKSRFEKGFPIDRVDLAAAKENPARLHRKIDEEYCMEMALAMQDGVDLPAIVVIETPSGLVLGTGMHRLEAATKWCKPARKKFDAYVVTEADAFRVELLVRSLNVIEARRGQTQEENLAQCIDMRRKFPECKFGEIARAFNLREGTVRDHLKFMKFDERAKDAGVGDLVSDGKRFPQVLKRELDKIGSNPVLARTIEIIEATEMVSGEAKRLAQDVASQRSERQSHALLDTREKEYMEQEAEKKERAKASYGKTSSTIATRAMSAVHHILKIKNGDDPDKLRFDAWALPDLRREYDANKRAIARLQIWDTAFEKLIQHLERRERGEVENPLAVALRGSARPTA